MVRYLSRISGTCPYDSLLLKMMQMKKFKGLRDRYIGSLFRVDEPVPDDSLHVDIIIILVILKNAAKLIKKGKQNS